MQFHIHCEKSYHFSDTLLNVAVMQQMWCFPLLCVPHRFSYSAVQYTAFHAKKFSALMKSNNGATTQQLEYELRSRAAAQALYRTITEFHTFFRRDTVGRVVKNAGYCKSLLGNFKGQNPDRFYFDVTKTHREVVDRVWSVLHPSSNAENTSDHSSSSESPSPTRERPLGSRPLPPIPRPSCHVQRSHSLQQRSHSMQEDARPPISAFHCMPPLPPYSQRSHSSDGIQLHPPQSGIFPMHLQSMSSVNPYVSPSISETGSDSDDLYMGGGSDTYTTMVSSRLEHRYIPSTRSDPGAAMSNSTQSDMYINSGESECSAASFDHQRINSPPPVYSEVDPEHSAPLNFTDVPNSAGLVIPDSGTMFNFNASGVLARTRELEGELQRLRTAMTCRLCKQNPIGATFCPCGHTVCCYQCAQRLRTCWECDETVHSVQRMILAWKKSQDSISLIAHCNFFCQLSVQ